MRRFFLALGVVAALAVAAGGSEAQFDLLIRGARVVDGTGNPWFRADVGVRDGRIAAVGRLSSASASETVDARDRVLAPGFVDVHTHVEGSESRPGIEDLPEALNFVSDGVTTIVTGNCGGSEIQLKPWFEKLEKGRLGLNVATLIGHNSVRRAVMGNANRAPTSEEMERMKDLVARAMDDGAVGFSTGLLYVPGTYAETSEVIELAKMAARFGGVYASHIRDQGDKLLDSIREAAEVGRAAGMPVQISHLKVKGRNLWGSIGQALDLIHRLRADGVDVLADAYPYDRASTGLGVNLPAWALEGGRDDLAVRLADPPTRARIIEDMKAMLTEFGYPDYSFATVASFAPEPSLAGKTISEINLLKGRPAGLDQEIETVLELMARGGAPMVYHYMSLEDVEEIFRAPFTAVASDGGVREPGSDRPHPRSYGTNARVLRWLVVQNGTLTLEDAIRRMTSLPARAFGFSDRGMVRPGMAADLVLFDPGAVRDLATFEDPHRYSVGFDSVWVNGEAVIREGRPTGLRPGGVLRRVP